MLGDLRASDSSPVLGYDSSRSPSIVTSGCMDAHFPSTMVLPPIASGEYLSKLPVKWSKVLRLNAISPYYTMFPLDFPFRQLVKASQNDWVLDPFCGRGTTNFAARLVGLPSIGIDSNPVAVATASAKLVDVRASDVAALCRSILSEVDDPANIPNGRFWDLCYHPETLRQICILREELMKDCATEERIALRALLLGVLHGPRMKNLPSYLSNQMPRTYATKPDSAVRYWEARSMTPAYVDVADLVVRRANHVFAHTLPRTAGRVILADSRNLSKDTISQEVKWIVTSPPYLGMETYAPDQWLRNWFVGGSETVCYGRHSQITHGSKASFIRELSKVWAQIALVSKPMAHLIIRFGGLPSYKSEPSEILKESIYMADSGWKITTIRSAGFSAKGYRQAEQFGKVGEGIEEIDLYAVLRK